MGDKMFRVYYDWIDDEGVRRTSYSSYIADSARHAVSLAKDEDIDFVPEYCRFNYRTSK